MSLATANTFYRLYNENKLTLKGAKNAVARGLISAEDFKAITGEDYTGDGTTLITPEELDEEYQKGVNEA